MIKNLQELIEAVKVKKPKTIAVAAAEDQDAIDILKQATTMGLANFILVGNASKVREMLSANGVTSETVEVIAADTHEQAAQKTIDLAVDGKCDVVMKGNLHTAAFLKAVLNKEAGFRKGDLITQVSVYDKFYGEGLQFLTDCAMAICPTLDEKKSIIENAVELSMKLGYEKPKVALLSALEVVNPKIQDTIDAAILSKMADRGQIKNAIVDGPFALDNAISPEAARHKNIAGPVAGQADILVVPNLQVGNVLTKALVYFAKRNVAAAVMGAAKPIVMTSRTDTVENKMLSIAMALYISDR
ncbi:MAG: bifunctional enoyl-CoA hydratase/phosphate acetyltransferase [Bacillota bacterium]|nr:bifunctional enoyl-CoA hydratase/phosphate acetyltransferase [Bacillota bacterium]